jgi:para-aminobenzoate synthetase/4-amino-4-deoxychorismate lyase
MAAQDIPPVTAASCFALLDDCNATAAHPTSRLYTGLTHSLYCTSAAEFPALLAALDGGDHAVGLFAYELGGALLGTAQRQIDAPLAELHFFSRCEVLSEEAVQQWLAAQVPVSPDAAGIADIDAIADSSGIAGIAGVDHAIDAPGFAAAITRIHDYIVAGDVYQINYTERVHFDGYGAPAALYRRLRERQPVPYGALVVLPNGRAVLSFSPELFLRNDAGTLTARPMKGTAPATDDAGLDRATAAALAADPKNRAENLMIVDLLRNDLGRIARLGSVQVPKLFEVERYRSVLQMTSTVRATLRDDTTLDDIFTAAFPCGSITGAPKQRAMQIIRELETAPRGLYTGALGWFEPPAPGRTVGDFCLSVLIRTLVLDAPSDAGIRKGVMGVGAGIVFDSVTADEQAECRLKAAFLTGLQSEFALFETMHADRMHGCRHRDRHLARIEKSAAYFGFRWDRAAVLAALQAACERLVGEGSHRMRLLLESDGEFTITAAPLAPITEPVRLLLSPQTMDANDLFLRHKTTLRDIYDAAWRSAEAQGAFDMLFTNSRGELTEGARSSIFLKLDGRWYTPPLDAGVLPGVMRGVLLDDPAWQATERRLTVADLQAAQEIMVCNALRGPIAARLGEGI